MACKSTMHLANSTFIIFSLFGIIINICLQVDYLGMDGLEGPLLSGTNFYINRKALLGFTMDINGNIPFQDLINSLLINCFQELILILMYYFFRQ